MFRSTKDSCNRCTTSTFCCDIALLRQPQDFEGTLPVPPEHESRHLAVPDVKEGSSLRPRLPEFQAARLAPPAGLDQRKHAPLVQRAVLVDLDAEVPPSLSQS